MHKVWLITGSSSGMGRAMTELVLSQGDIAVATLRKPSVLDDLVQQYPRDRLLVVKLDVTNKDEIKAAFAKAREVYGRIDVVFNNAGYGILGETESVPEEVARRMFDTNFWGALNVALEAVRFFRDVNKPQGGRLITNSSIVAVTSAAAVSIYSASKHALEGVMESLAKELNPAWNIKMTCILPGGFHTRGTAPESLVQTEPLPAYDFENSNVARVRAWAPNASLPGDIAKAMKVIYHQLATMEDPPVRAPLGKDALLGFQNAAKAYSEDVERCGSFSDDVLLDGADIANHVDPITSA
ncbi:NAD(P)-binding protein [Daedalea quercina L-15889]|uniref:NAD(P)-binding protein n=1 Tax=Daedalea quercina L-15889 TaxID=1314783 RepID=A0A165LKD4_9APHY|nr:NAD(P)-binding protein [Daedalea quercina L-15889]